MVFTIEEENILKLMIAQMQAQKKLDIQKAVLNADLNNSIAPILTQMSTLRNDVLNLNNQKNGEYKTAIDLLEINLNNANKALEDAFK